MSKPSIPFNLVPATVDRAAPRLRSAAWVVRRAAIGITVLVGFVASGAWLLHASIDAQADAVEQSAPSE